MEQHRQSNNALIIGAGAVGSVLAYHLHRAGKVVALYDRPDRVASLRNGITLYPLGHSYPRLRPTNFLAYDAVADQSLLEGRPWRMVFVCTPSDALQPSFLSRLSRIAGDASIVKIQPGMNDRAIYEKHFDNGAIVSTLVSFVAYGAPLSNETATKPGIAYWSSPLAPTLFSGLSTRTAEVTRVLRAGGLHVRAVKDVETILRYLLAVQAPLAAAYRSHNGAIRDFLKSREFSLATRAADEAVSVVTIAQQRHRPFMLSHVSERLLRAAVSILPRMYPFPLESYLRAHYSKLERQTRLHIDDYIVQGLMHGLPVTNLTELRRRSNESSLIASPTRLGTGQIQLA